MSHFCICPKCNQKFDRDKIQAVKVSSRRYGHATCYPDNKDFVPLIETKEQNPDYIALMNYIKKIFGDKANYAQINRQLKIYITENGYSYSGIMKSLIFFFEVQGNSIDKANGAIGIVPYVYQAAYQYYYNLFIIQSQNKGKDIPSIVTKVKEVTIPIPRIPKKKGKFFHFLDEELEENE